MGCKVRIVAFSDTHTLHEGLVVPDGDVLVFAGDLMNSGYNYKDIDNFAKWFNAHPHKKKIWIAGNHDRWLEHFPVTAERIEGDYLIDSGVEYEGVKFWGSPYTPFFNDWAFNTNPSHMYNHWKKIPLDTDILITHGPPLGILDASLEYGKDLGCPTLLEIVKDVKPFAHIFGHIHGGYGQLATGDHGGIDTVFYNASICNEQYKIANKPWVIDVHPSIHFKRG